MSSKYDEILSKIKTTKDKANEGVTKHVLKTDIIGNIITGRFLPNLKDVNPETGDIPSEYLHYFHFLKSKLDNSTVFINCLNTIGERCPVCTKSIAFYRSTDPVQKARSTQISRKHSFITNFYVISDLKNPQNNGKVMLLKYGKQIDMKIKGALEGEMAKFYGTRIYRLDSEGCTFMIKPEKNSDAKEAWVTYSNSCFLPASSIDGMTDEKMTEIMDGVIAIAPLHNKCKSVDEINDILNKHYFINDVQHQSDVAVNNLTSVLTKPAQTPTPAPAPAPVAPAQKVESVNEEDLDKMLAELG